MSNFLPHPVEKAVYRILEDLATPTSLKTSLLVKYGEWDQLALQAVDPRHYLDSESYWRDATAISLLRKLKDLPTTFDREAACRESFFASEKKCLRTNRRLFPYLCPGLPDTDTGVLSFIGRVRKKIGDILGPVPAVFDGRFGPGATFGDRGQLTTIPDKMSSEPTLTHEAWAYHIPWSSTLWAKACSASDRRVNFVRGNRFTTVPKDASKFRGIAVEPSINVFFQLGLGRVIRKRLKAIGIDLSIGQDIHRRVACEASIRGHFATLDLSNASDTVSRNLVKLLLPTRWYEVLDDLRSKRTRIDGSWVLLEKFSSMGNGFTFELETLIFLGICLAISDDLRAGKDVFVFGDDIIIPTRHSKDVIAALEFFGMEVNKAKSFYDGPFRESCGGDFFLGVDVRPHFLKELPIEPQHLISWANGLTRLSSGAEGRSPVLRRAWFCILDALPNHIRSLRGPKDLGDLCVHDLEERWQSRWRNSIRYIRVYRPARFRKVSWQNFKPDVTLAAAVYGVPWNNGGIIPRDSVAGYKIGWVARS